MLNAEGYRGSEYLRRLVTPGRDVKDSLRESLVLRPAPGRKSEMSKQIGFDKDGICYGLLFTFGKRWEMSFYTTEVGRKRGAKYLKSLGHDVLSFEITLKEIHQRAHLIPYVPKTDKRVSILFMNGMIKVRGTDNDDGKEKYVNNS